MVNLLIDLTINEVILIRKNVAICKMVNLQKNTRWNQMEGCLT